MGEMNPPLVDQTAPHAHHRSHHADEAARLRSSRHHLPNGFHHTDYGGVNGPPPPVAVKTNGHARHHDDDEGVEAYNGLARRPSNLDRDAKLRAQSFIMSKRRSEKEKSDGSFRMKTTITNTPKIKISRHFSFDREQPDDAAASADKNEENAADGQHKIMNNTSNYKPEEEAAVSSPSSPLHQVTKPPQVNGFSSDKKLNGRLNKMSLTSAFSSSSDDSDLDTNGRSSLTRGLESSNSSSTANLKLSSNKLTRQISQETRSSFQDDQSASVMISPLAVDSLISSSNKASPTSAQKKEAFARSHSLMPSSFNSTSNRERSSDSFDLSMFDLINNYNTSKNFILKPATISLLLKCQLFRKKKFGSCKYRFYLENLDGQLILIMTADKRKKSKTPTYIINYISFDLNDVQKYKEIPVAKLKSNLLGTQFTLHDLGAKPTSGSLGSSSYQMTPSPSPIHARANSPSFFNNNDKASTFMKSGLNEDLVGVRKEYASISYELNPFGIRGPRSMSVIIPGMDFNHAREDFQLRSESDSLLQAWKSIEHQLISGSNSASNDSAQTITNPKKLTQSLSNCEASPAKSCLNETRSNKSSSPEQENVKKSSSAVPLTNGKSTPAPLIKPNERNVVKLINKAPVWHAELKSFALSFNGRVTKSSTKNYQIVHEAQTDYVVTQFGKVESDMYTCDYMYPLCALQAFGLALSSLDSKLGCD